MPFSVNGEGEKTIVKLFIPNNGVYFNLDKVHLYNFQNNKTALYRSFDLNGEQTFMEIPRSEGNTTIRFLYDTKENRFFDLLLSDDDTVVVQVNAQSPSKYLTILKGKVNKAYIDFLNEKDKYDTLISTLEKKYKVESDSKKQKLILAKIKTTRTNFSNYCSKASSENKGNILGLIIASTPIRNKNLSHSPQQQKATLIDSYWKGINLENEELLNTFLFHQLIENYVGLYFEEEYSPKQQDSALYVAIDKTILVFSNTEKHKKFAYEFLKNGFEIISHKKMVDYLALTHKTPEQCSSEEEKEELIKLQNSYEKMKIGSKAPDIEWTDSANQKHNLKDISSDTILVVFWSSSCPHCTEALPFLSHYAPKKNWKVVTVSVDMHPDSYYTYIKNYPDWIHVCDFKGWKSTPVMEYNITGTPTFILMDSSRKIIDKLNSWEQLSVYFK